MSPVDEIAKKEVVCVGALSAVLEELFQVVELPVNITTQRDLHTARNVARVRSGVALERAGAVCACACVLNACRSTAWKT